VTAPITEQLEHYRNRVDQALLQNLPDIKQTGTTLEAAMHYATLNGGKRVRPVLVYATGIAFGADPDILDVPACAIEYMHAYSLVHDDLPSMDDDDLRRGNQVMRCRRLHSPPSPFHSGTSSSQLPSST